ALIQDAARDVASRLRQHRDMPDILPAVVKDLAPLRLEDRGVEVEMAGQGAGAAGVPIEAERRCRLGGERWRHGTVSLSDEQDPWLRPGRVRRQWCPWALAVSAGRAGWDVGRETTREREEPQEERPFGGNVELLVDPQPVVLDRALAEAEASRDIVSVRARDDQADDLALARRQPVEVGGGLPDLLGDAVPIVRGLQREHPPAGCQRKLAVQFLHVQRGTGRQLQLVGTSGGEVARGAIEGASLTRQVSPCLVRIDRVARARHDQRRPEEGL